MEEQFIFFPRLPLACSRHPSPPFPHELTTPHLEQSLVSCKMELMEQAAGTALGLAPSFEGIN